VPASVNHLLQIRIRNEHSTTNAPATQLTALNSCAQRADANACELLSFA